MAFQMAKSGQRYFEIMNIPQWHEAGYTGKGIKIFEVEYDTDHCQQVFEAGKIVAPDAEFYNREGIRREDLLDYVDHIKPNIVAMAQDFNMANYEWFAKGLHERGIPFFKSADNDGDLIKPNELAYSPYVMTIGAISSHGNKANYSEYGEALDFVGFPIIISGTSITQMTSGAALTALLMQRYGQMTPYQVYCYWQNHCKDLGELGFDIYTGYGMPVLPDVKEVYEMNKPNKIILHHSATDGGTFESIKKYHVEHNGWDDIGYHYLIQQDGSLHKGRNEKTVGAHCLGQNDSSIGICLVGNFDKYEPNDKQMKSLNDLIIDINMRLGITEIQGHNHYSEKTCPGIYFRWKDVVKLEQKKEQVSDWAKEAWNKAVKKGINDGQGPKNPVTEEQMMVFFDRLGLLD